MSSPTESRQQPLLRRIFLVGGWTCGVLVCAGVVVFFITRFDYGLKPQILNFLGLNPTIKWVGKVAPPFSLAELNSTQKVSLKKYRGKVVMLDFWASWCHDCLKHLPMIQRLHRDPSVTSKVQILSINVKEHGNKAKERVKLFMHKHKFDFPVLMGDIALTKKYKVWFVPAVVIINKKGRVFYSGAEYHEEKALRELLAKAEYSQ